MYIKICPHVHTITHLYTCQSSLGMHVNIPQYVFECVCVCVCCPSHPCMQLDVAGIHCVCNCMYYVFICILNIQRLQNMFDQISFAGHHVIMSSAQLSAMHRFADRSRAFRLALCPEGRCIPPKYTQRSQICLMLLKSIEQSRTNISK